MPSPYTKADYLYQRMGPWPQPSPGHPQGQAPGVVHIPPAEQRRWQRKIGNRYLFDFLTYWPVALFKAFQQRTYPEISDDRFNTLMTTGINARYLVDTLDPPDREHFAPILDASPGDRFLKIDLTPISAVRPYKGMYVGPSVVLVREPTAGGPLAVAALWIGDKLITPADRNAYDLAKYFVLQGAAYGILFTVHPNLHFPFDTINAVTKTALPTKHLLFKLLSPHLDFQLALDNAVLNSPRSIVSNSKSTLYDPFTARADDGLMNFFIAGYAGVPGNSAYPPYTYAMRPKPVYGPYGRFLDAYYKPYFDFAKTVTDRIDRNDPLVLEWARYIAMWIPGFPNEQQIMVGDNLAAAAAGFMWDVTIGHAADHTAYVEGSSIAEKCFRLRVPPPASAQIDPVDRRHLAKPGDLFRGYLAERLFFRPKNVSRLLDVKYDFNDGSLIAASNRFFQDLREVELELRDEGVPLYARIGEAPASIQY